MISLLLILTTVFKRKIQKMKNLIKETKLRVQGMDLKRRLKDLTRTVTWINKYPNSTRLKKLSRIIIKDKAKRKRFLVYFLIHSMRVHHP